jgi:hypothetical protein
MHHLAQGTKCLTRFNIHAERLGVLPERIHVYDHLSPDPLIITRFVVLRWTCRPE